MHLCLGLGLCFSVFADGFGGGGCVEDGVDVHVSVDGHLPVLWVRVWYGVLGWVGLDWIGLD